MLPFTTYHIPESPTGKTDEEDKPLYLIVQKPLSGEHADLLKKISSALKSDYSTKVNCIEVETNESILLAEHLSPVTKLIISFGVPPSALGLWIDLPHPGMRKLEQFTFILTLPLESMSANANAKKDLWKWMQMFMEQS